MDATVDEAKAALDALIGKARVDLYKPIQIAEVLHRARLSPDLDLSILETYRNPSLQWRNAITVRLTGKRSTSSARYQHDLWNETAMPIRFLTVLDTENKRTGGAVEQYIYLRYGQRLGTVAQIIAVVEAANPETFALQTLLELFQSERGIRRSIDKAYEIVAHALFETITTVLDARIRVRVPAENGDLLAEFSDLAQSLLGLETGETEREEAAHIYRVGVTNASDRGLDMWANFGAAIQVKHLTLDDRLANVVVDQVESDRIVIVCRDTDASVIETIAKQIGWGKRVRGIVTESRLVDWYDRCLRGTFSDRLGAPLLERLRNGFHAEFPHSVPLATFIEERGYLRHDIPAMWQVDAEE